MPFVPFKKGAAKAPPTAAKRGQKMPMPMQDMGGAAQQLAQSMGQGPLQDLAAAAPRGLPPRARLVESARQNAKR